MSQLGKGRFTLVVGTEFVVEFLDDRVEGGNFDRLFLDFLLKDELSISGLDQFPFSRLYFGFEFFRLDFILDDLFLLLFPLLLYMALEPPELEHLLPHLLQL